MVETITAAASPALDHIIERPRLIARLAEGGGARVTVLAAPAGYGKTTLARQWSEQQSGPVAWYRTTRASGDVALLAVQLDDLLASIAPELPREQPTVASIASVNPSPKPLARAILRSFEKLTRDVLLVVDEWEAAGTDEAEELLATLVDGLDIRFLITTRTRPEWFTPRLEIYGEGLEIGMDELAMTDEEAARVLTETGAVAGRARLMRSADGWPAVLGLAAMTGDVDFTSSRLLSHTLYEFLASELLAAAKPETQDALMVLAVASISDVDLARSVLGADSDRLIEDALARGLVAITDRKSLSLHPLLRELLLRRFEEADAEARELLLSRCRSLLDGRRWDEALSVAESTRDPRFAAEAIGAALDDLLAAGRTSSLQRWVAAARAAGAEGGLVDYAESEALLRYDELDQALALAAQATRSLEGDLAARAHLVAGRSAHLIDRPARTKQHAELAEASAETAATQEGAQWLRIVHGIEAQAPDLAERLEHFRVTAGGGLNQTLMIATANLCLAQIEGGLIDALEDAKSVLRLATGGADPIHLTGFLTSYGYGLLLCARYGDGLERLDELISVTENYGIEFPVRFAHLNRAMAFVGLRRFASAARTLSMLERQIREGSDGYFVPGNLPVQRARLYASVGELERAMDALSFEPPKSAARAIRDEVLGWQAVLSAVAGDRARAKDLVSAARQGTNGLETKALTLLAEALIALDEEKRETAASRLRAAIETAVWDPFVIAIRASPDFGTFIAEQPELRAWLQRLLISSRDASVAGAIGLTLPREVRSRSVLSPRESEVHELLAQGLTNEEIANLLYISLSTTKVHVKHIYSKLGVRSRLEAARALRDDV
jgi:LuxR family transcriptional regulator, maltose regulon positive regulatory protein